MHTQVPDTIPRLTLPVTTLVGGSLAAGAIVGAAWAIVVFAVTRDPSLTWGSLLAGAGSGVAAALALLAISPWRERPLTTWPPLVLAATMGMAVLTLGVGFLLHFATPLGSWSIWLCLVAAYWCELAVVARTYAAHVKQAQTVEGPSESPVDDGSVTGA